MNFIVIGRENGKNAIGPALSFGALVWNGEWKALVTDEELAGLRSGELELVPIDPKQIGTAGCLYKAVTKA